MGYSVQNELVTVETIADLAGLKGLQLGQIVIAAGGTVAGDGGGGMYQFSRSSSSDALTLTDGSGWLVPTSVVRQADLTAMSLVTERSHVAQKIVYPGMYSKAPLWDTMLPFGTTAINEAAAAGTSSRTLSVDSTVMFDGRPTTKCVIVGAGSSTSLEIGVSTAAITLSSGAQALLDRELLIAVKTDGANTVSGVNLYVGDGSYTNNYQLSSTDYLDIDGWRIFSRTPTAPVTTGTPDLSASVRAKIRFTMASNVAAGSLWFGVAAALPAPKPRIVLTFDDGYDEWTWLAARLAERGLPASFGIAQSLIGAAGYLTISEMLSIANDHDGLFELTNHARTNDTYTTLGLSTYMADVNLCRDWLVALGADPYAASLHQYVQGVYDTTLIDALIAAGYHSARRAGGAGVGAKAFRGAVSAASADLYRLPATCSLENTQNLSTVQGYFASAVKTGAAVLMGHRFEESAGAVTWIRGYDSSYGVLNLLDWLTQKRDDDGWVIQKWSDYRREMLAGTAPMLRPGGV